MSVHSISSFANENVAVFFLFTFTVLAVWVPDGLNKLPIFVFILLFFSYFEFTFSKTINIDMYFLHLFLRATYSFQVVFGNTNNLFQIHHFNS